MEEQKPRSAVDILLSLESEMNHLKQMIHNLDLNIRIISNKINQNMNVQPNIFTPTINYLPSSESINDKMDDLKAYEQGLSVETNPTGPRRNAHPISSDFLNKNNVPMPSLPQEQSFQAEISLPNTQHSVGVRKQVSQRIVDRNSKPIFMAEVEILNISTNIMEIKTRTNGTGKWQASLAHGQYKIRISKQQAANKSKIEVIQDLIIDDNTPADLQMMVIK